MKIKAIPPILIGALFSVLCLVGTPDFVNAQGLTKRGGFGKLFKRSTKEIPTKKAPKSITPSDSKAIALREILIQAIPERHYKETLVKAIVLSYHQRRYRNIWNHKTIPSQLYADLGQNLIRHGLPEKAVLSPTAISNSIGRCPVNLTDLGITVAIADAGTMVKLGAVSQEVIWPKWNKGDKPGTNRWSAQDIANDITKISKYPIFNAQHAIDTMAPRNWVYRELQNGYAAARNAKFSQLPPIPNPSSTGAARPGQAYAHAAALAETLAARGFLNIPQAQRQSLTSVTAELAEGIRAFQRSRGLTADGIMGPGTWRSLTTNDAARYKTRLINLHRARLLGDTLGERYLMVNLPSAELYGFEKGKHVMTMRIVHGKNTDEDFHTPVFRDVMSDVVFAPYWNVPESISTKEIYPKILEDETFLERNRYEIVNHFNDDATVYEFNEETLEKIGSGDLWIRQKPTGHNALGKVKFLLPNQFHIYLHDTPSKQHFQTADRAQSHGCIRLASPPQLAEWVLASQDWDQDRISETMESETEIKEKLVDQVNVYTTYFTEFPRPVGISTGKYSLGPARDVYEKDSQHEATLSPFLP